MPEQFITLHKPDLPKIEMMYAYIASDAGGEGLCGFHSPSGWLPMVCADMARVESLRPIAEKLAKCRAKDHVSSLSFARRVGSDLAMRSINEAWQ
jgi:hypothetical protein